MRREQSDLTYNSTNYQCRKRAEQSNTQYCLLLYSITNGHLLFVIGELNIQKAQKAKLNKQQKMLLSLRSNPQTMSPYIQESDGLCTSTDHHLITTYCSTYGSVFVLK